MFAVLDPRQLTTTTVSDGSKDRIDFSFDHPGKTLGGQNMLSIECSPYECNQIVPNIFVGPLPPVGDSLSQYFSDIFLCARDYQPNSDCFRDVVSHSCPLDDDEEPFTESEIILIEHTVGLALEKVLAGYPCLFTCYSGLNRSALIAGLVCIRLGMSPMEVLNKMRTERGPKSLSNDKFVQMMFR